MTKLTFLVCIASTSASSIYANPQLEAFTLPPDIRQITISPTGDALAAIKTVQIDKDTTKDILVVLNYPELTLSGTLALKEGLHVGSYYWANPTRLVARASSHVSRFDGMIYTNQLFGVNADGTGVSKLTTYAAVSLISKINSDPEHVLVARYRATGRRADTEAGRLNVYDGTYTRIARASAKNAELFADVAGNLRLSISTDDDLSVRLNQYDPKTRRWSLLKTSPFEASVPRPVRISASGRYVDLLTTMDRGPEGIYRFDTHTGQQQEIYRHKIADALPILDHEGVMWAVQHHHARGELVLIEKSHPLSLIHAQVSAQFPDNMVTVSSSALDYSRVVLRIASASATTQWYIFESDGDDRTLTKLFDTNPHVNDDTLGEVKPISFHASDGVELHGYLATPRHKQPPYPLVVMPHGGPLGIKDIWQYDPLVQVLSTQGFAVLQINYRGSAGYGAYFQSLGIGEYGGDIHQDITDGTRWALQKGVAQLGNVCIIGSSYGGYAAIYGAAKEPSLYDCAVGIAGPYDLVLQHKKADYSAFRVGRAFSKRAVGQDKQSRRKISPITYVDKIKMPILLVHGVKDRRVPIVHARRMRKALTKAGNAPEYLEFPYEGHGIQSLVNKAIFYRQLIEFLATHIGKGQIESK